MNSNDFQDSIERSVLFFLHIPKTAGSSVCEVLARNLRDKLIYVPHVFLEGPIPKRKLSFWLKEDASKKSVVSHRLSLDLPWNNPCFETIAFTVVRNPYSWIRSQYHYCRQPGIISFSPAKDAKDFPSFLESLMGFETQSNLINGQHYHITKDSDEDPFQLARNGKLILLPQDRIEEGMLRLEWGLPEFFHDASVPRLNVAKKQSNNEVPETLKTRFEEKNHLDQSLYQLSHELLDSWIDEHGGESWAESLAQFQRRCKIRTNLKSPVQSFASRVASVISRW